MKPTFIVSILIFSFIATCSTFAQQSTEHISGRVTDTNGEPLPGATISIRGKNRSRHQCRRNLYITTARNRFLYHYCLLHRLSNRRKKNNHREGKENKLPFIRRSVRPRNSRCNRYPYSQIAEGRSHHHPGNHLR